MEMVRRIVIGTPPPTLDLLAPISVAVAGAALGIAYFSSPFLRFVDLRTFMIAGFMGVIGVTLAQVGVVRQKQMPWTIARWLFTVSVINLVTLGFSAFNGARANDNRCLALQRDMLSAFPRKANGPAIFEALGCRPQGEGSVYVPRAET